MAQLYTVRMVSKRIISRYDDKGRKIGEREDLVPQVYHDLPYQTALSYKTKFPDNKVDVVAQDVAFEAPHKSRPAAADEPRTKRPATRQTPPPSAIDHAARTGDMAAAINVGVE